MIKSIHRLVRATRFQADALRRRIVELEILLDREQDVLVAHDQQIEIETKLANQMPMTQKVLPFYLASMREKRQEITRNIDEFQLMIEQLQNALVEKFSELKRFEHYEKNLIEQMKYERDRKEQVIFDEVGIKVFERNKSAL